MEVLGEKIIVKRIIKTETESGIYIPHLEDKPISTGRIVGIGRMPEGYESLKVGDEIVWMAYAGTEFEVNGEDLLVVRPNDIVGRLGGKEN